MTPQEEAQFNQLATRELGPQSPAPPSMSAPPPLSPPYGGIESSMESGGAYGGMDTEMDHPGELSSGGSGIGSLAKGASGLFGAVGKSLMTPKHEQAYSAIFGHNMSPTGGSPKDSAPSVPGVAPLPAPRAGAASTLTPQEEAELNKMAAANGVQMSDRRTKTSIRSGEGDTQELLERLAANGWIGRAK